MILQIFSFKNIPSLFCWVTSILLTSNAKLSFCISDPSSLDLLTPPSPLWCIEYYAWWRSSSGPEGRSGDTIFRPWLPYKNTRWGINCQINCAINNCCWTLEEKQDLTLAWGDQVDFLENMGLELIGPELVLQVIKARLLGTESQFYYLLPMGP